MSPEQARAILADIRVADFTQQAAGPTAARILAEMGADVVHVEPLSGDAGRAGTSAFLGNDGPMHQIVNRSKRDLALDLHSRDGRAVAQRLIEWADIIIEAMRPGSFAHNGFTYERIKELNPGAIYVSLTAYGARGPLRDVSGYDFVVQAYTGVVHLSDDGEPSLLGYLVGDPAAPLLACIAILGALRERDRTGRGQMVEVSLLDGVLHMIAPTLLWVDDDPELSGTSPRPIRDPTTAVFEAADATYVVVVALNDAQFRRLFEVIGLPELAVSPRYATRPLRVTHGEEIFGLMSGMMLTRRAEEWVTLLREADVPCATVRLERRELIKEEQLWDNEMLVEVHHPTKGRMVQPGMGFRLSESPIGVRNAAPSLGQDSRSVLTDLGYSDAQIAELIEHGVITAGEELSGR
jgi:formyl-CoA transferase/CoA:oxalate CoA-transferase